MASVNPYPNFAGECEEAFGLYQRVLGGEMNLTRFADMEMGTPPEEADRVMHVSFLLADGQILMGSDRLASMGQVTAGDSVHVMLGPDTVEEGERLFAVLSDGGTVSMPIGPVPWDAHYGAFVDRFGISWMLDVEHH